MKIIEALNAALGDLERNGSLQKPDGGAHTRTNRHNNTANAGFFCKPCGMQGCPATKGNHGAGRQITAKLNGMNPCRIGHVLVHNFSNTRRRPEILQAQLVANIFLQCCLCSIRLQGNLASCKKRRVNFSQHHIGIGDGGFHAATAIAGRTRVGACTVRANGDALQLVHPCNGTTACTNLHHFNDRNANGYAGTLHVLVGTRNLEAMGSLWLIILQQANLRRGSPHVERHNIPQFQLLRHARREDSPTRRSGLHQTNGKAARRFQRRQPPARHHQVERRIQLHRSQAILQALKIARHQRPHIGIGDCGGEPFILANLRCHFAGYANRHIIRE